MSKIILIYVDGNEEFQVKFFSNKTDAGEALKRALVEGTTDTDNAPEIYTAEKLRWEINVE